MQKVWAVNHIDNKTAEILLYGYIGSEQVNAADFVAQLKLLESKCNTIKIRVNSGGGSVFEGLTIFNAIKNSTCNVEAYIDGLAASMASIIVLACNKIYMSKVAMLMTHRPNGAAMGNPDELRSSADMLDSLEQTISAIYAERTGLTAEAAKAKYMGASDSWFTADEAKVEKLIDGIYDAPKPKAVLPPASMRKEKDLVNYFTNFLKPQSNMNQITLSANVMAVLSLTADAVTDDAANNAIAALATKAAKVDSLQNELTTANNKITQLETAADTAKAETLIETAVANKKILVGDKEKYVRLAKADYDGTKALIDSIQPYQSIEGQMQTADAEAKAESAELMKLSGRELYMKGKFERLKQINLSGFKAKYKEYYGAEYKG